MKSLKIVFAGTPDFAVPTLAALVKQSPHHQIVAVYTQPDRPAGRGLKLTPSPVKVFARAHHLPVHQPKSLRSSEEEDVLKNLRADVMIVVAYGLILPQAILDIPRLGCVNVHASLLPRWRGAAPIQHAILAGDTVTGISIMQMDAGLDTGPVFQQIPYKIQSTDTAQIVHDVLSQLGHRALFATLEGLATGSIKPVPQNNNLACYAPKIEKVEAEIAWSCSATQILHQIRAFNSWPIAFTYLDNTPLRVWQAIVVPEITTAKPPGTILQTAPIGIDVATGDGVLRLQTLQFPGGKPLPVSVLLHAKQALFKEGSIFKKL